MSLFVCLSKVEYRKNTNKTPSVRKKRMVVLSEIVHPCSTPLKKNSGEATEFGA